MKEMKYLLAETQTRQLDQTRAVCVKNGKENAMIACTDVLGAVEFCLCFLGTLV